VLGVGKGNESNVVRWFGRGCVKRQPCPGGIGKFESKVLEAVSDDMLKLVK
jgi:hypothetical protein